MKYPRHNKIKSFTDLTVWQKGHELVLLIYEVTKQFPKSESYILIDQMRRAVTSITANIAEGFGRNSFKDKLRFYYQAQGSLTELKDQILTAKDLKYIPEKKDYEIVMKLADTTHKLLRGFINKTKELIQIS